MKKLICILASAALLGACEQKTEVVAPAATPAPETKSVATAEMGQRQKKPKSDPGASLSTAAKPAENAEKKAEEASQATTEAVKEEAAATPQP